jgi:hypothetical protein
MRFLGKLSLVLVFLTFPYVLPSSSKSDRCDPLSASVGNSLAWGTEIKKFGRNGQDGKSATNGTKGQDSDNITIFADGSPMTLNLSGQNGVNGENGSDGKDANCSTQPQKVDYNL